MSDREFYKQLVTLSGKLGVFPLKVLTDYGRKHIGDFTKTSVGHSRLEVYICGAITNGGEKPNPTAVEEFDKAEKIIKDLFPDFAVINPVKIIPNEVDWQTAMKILIPELIFSDFVYVLENYQSSKGAKLEITIAEALGIPIFYQKGENLKELIPFVASMYNKKEV